MVGPVRVSNMFTCDIFVDVPDWWTKIKKRRLAGCVLSVGAFPSAVRKKNQWLCAEIRHGAILIIATR
mgnify:CR=1 FL=1|jgi:hypothetical protein